MPGFKQKLLQLLFIKKNCLTLIAILGIVNIALAQQGQGKLTGKVTDGSTNEPLAGVSVTVKGKKAGTSSITDGTYILTLSAGVYTIAVSYQSYSKKELSGVEIKAGQTTFLDVILDKADNKLTDVVITSSAKKESQSSVYSAQKRSAAASDGISLEAIRKTPDNNAGQILKRVTGVSVQDNRFVVVRGLGEQYNQTTLNGVPMTSTETNRNAFAFDLIPAAVIDNITINKTATPDMPGNFAGGIVQINTKDFPAKDFYSIALQVGFSDGTLGKDFYSDKRGSLEQLAFSGDNRDLPKGFPTNTSIVPFTSLNLQEQFRYLKQLKNNLAPINYGPSRPNENIQLGYGKTIKFKNESQIGIVAAINQRKTEFIESDVIYRDPLLFTGGIRTVDSNTITGISNYSENTRYRFTADLGGVLNLAYRFGNNKITLKNLYTRVLNNTYTDRSTLISDNASFTSANSGISYFVEQRSILNSTLSGEHRTGKNNETRIDWNFNVTSNRIYTPDLRNFILADAGGGLVTIASGNADLPASLIGFSRVWANNNDKIYGGAFNITTPFDLFKSKQLFKSGILFQNRTRQATGTVLPIAGLKQASTIDDLLLPEKYYPSGNEVNISSSSLAGGGGNYNAGSSLLATYFSLEDKIGKKTRIIWGVRAENYLQTVNVYKPVYFQNILQPELDVSVFASRSTFNFLPSVNFIYSPFQSINIRAAASRTVIRPELKDLAEYQRFDPVTFVLTTGNSQLKSSSISNYDVKLEWFPSAGEIVSFAAFYKKIKDPIEYASSYGLTVASKFALNTGDAWVRGLEAEARKKIDFIKALPWLSHLTLFGNGAMLRSKVAGLQLDNILLSSFAEHTLTGQPRYIVNGGVSIALFKESFEATISLNRTGDYINELGSNDLDVTLANGIKIPTRPHFIVKARNMVDMVVSQAILKNRGKFKFNIINLLKQRYILYQDLNGNGKFEPGKIVFQPGIVSLQGNGDNAVSNITPQRAYSISFTYTF